jgi:uncharacterized protein YoxC
MTAAAVVAIVGALLIVVVLAAYLIYVAFALKAVSSRLTTITAGLGAIPEKTAPLAPVITQINKDLTAADDKLHTVLTTERQPELPAPWVVVPKPRAPLPGSPAAKRAR